MINQAYTFFFSYNLEVGGGLLEIASTKEVQHFLCGRKQSIKASTKLIYTPGVLRKVTSYSI